MDKKNTKTKILIFGTGQVASTVFRLIDQNKYEILGFVDNDNQKKIFFDYPVYRPSDAGALNSDKILIAVKGEDRVSSIKNQMGAGFDFITPDYDLLDIRLAETRLLAEQIEKEKIPGAVAELGVYKGDFAAELCKLFKEREIVLFDTFTGFDKKDLQEEEPIAATENFADTNIEIVKEKLRRDVTFVVGRFPDSVTDDEISGATDTRSLPETYCFVSLDVDLYAPTLAGLKYFYPRLSEGGAIIIHDVRNTRFKGPGKALAEFTKENRTQTIPLADIHGSVLIGKQVLGVRY